MKKIVNLIAILVVLNGVGLAQDSLPKNNTIYLSPFKLIKNSLQVDFERRFAPGRSQFVLSPMVTLGTIKDRTWPFDTPEQEMIGIGAEVLHRVYIKPDTQLINLYFAHGPMYHFMQVNYTATDWYEGEVDGEQVFVRETRDGKATIHKMGYSLHLGTKIVIDDAFVIDGYMGVGLRYSPMNATLPTAPDVTDGISNYAFTGNSFVAGLRFGILLF